MNLDPTATTIRYDRKRHRGLTVELHPREESVVITLVFEGWEAREVFSISARRTPAGKGGLTPDELRRLADAFPLLILYARAEILLDRKARPDYLVALRELGRTRRGLKDLEVLQFAREAIALKEAGEPHVGKVLAERHALDKSNVSRRLTRARALGYLSANSSG